MKRIISIILMLLVILSSTAFAEDLDLFGEAAILVDPNTGQILFEKNSHMKLHPASTTKIMTGILAIEHGNLDDIVTIDQEIVNLTDGSHIALEPGENISFSDLLNATLIESANDAALAIAKHVSGSIDEFAKLMNEKALEIGALDTHFVNPNGLTHVNHLTTAYDLSLIATYAMKNPKFRDIVKIHASQMSTTNKKDEGRYFNSYNRLLYSDMEIEVDGEIIPAKYEGITGVKTGYTGEAGNCLVSSATRGNDDFIAVVMKSDKTKVFSDSHKLLNYGFDGHKKTSLGFKDQFIDNINIKNGDTSLVAGILEEDLIAYIPINMIDNIEKKIILEDEIIAPIKKGEALGLMEYRSGDYLIGEINVLSTLDVEEIPIKEMSSFSGLFGLLKSKWYLFLAGILIFVAFIIRIRNIKKRNERRRRRHFL